jgi:hypothetical protein
VRLLWLTLALACTTRPATRCQEVCRHEASCADQLDQPDTDVAECIDRCSVLDRSEDTRKSVDDHVSCVKEASDCQAVLDCP